MKRNLLLLYLLTICVSFIFSMPSDTRKQIMMKVRQKIDHRSTIPLSPVQVYNNHSLLTIEFNSPAIMGGETISIINLLTGEVIYNETIINPEKFKLIDLCNEDKTAEYKIEITSRQWSAIGVFTIE